ncbi:GNAT family N-acetyltransferase [Nakamurella lactea]|uniref:GNAT family N-acetyltransferase n=1 Tax=Nakamurella lactea TaxID=459515 RepID=UPI0004243210|nr:GNAT family N-acetyltransferase [Nakamurella lactea]
MDPSVDVRVRGQVSDEELNVLHTLAFGHGPTTVPWNDRLTRHSLTWVTARLDSRLCGFVNIIGDGGAHAVLLDACVAPDLQGRGIGRVVVRAAAQEAKRLGCQWLHADYEPGLVSFYEDACGMRSTAAGLLQLLEVS